jgi:hypothetical protein
MSDICKNCGHHLDDHRKRSCEGMNGCFCDSSSFESEDSKGGSTEEIIDDTLCNSHSLADIEV